MDAVGLLEEDPVDTFQVEEDEQFSQNLKNHHRWQDTLRVPRKGAKRTRPDRPIFVGDLSRIAGRMRRLSSFFG